MKTIQQKSLAYLSCIGIAIMLVVFLTSYWFAAKFLDNKLNDDIEFTSRVLAVVFQEPVFSYDEVLTQDILDSFVKFPHISSIAAFDHRNKLIAKSQDREADNTIIARTVPVLWEGERNVGKVDIEFQANVNEGLLNAIAITMVVVALVLIVSFQLANWFILTRFVIKPVRVVGQAMAEIAQGGGDLTKRLKVKTRDEVGELAQGFNAFVSNLHGLVGRTVESAQLLNACSESIRSDTTSNAAATQAQLTEINQVSIAISQMSASSQQVAQSAMKTSQTTRSSSSLAQGGNLQVRKTIEEVHELGDKITLTSDKIVELKEKSQRISTVLEVIKSIAEQTNLLALNAAIEAARAGEQGRGFAVVADEVRALAQRTQDSTTEIEQIINNVQSSSEDASNLMGATKAMLADTIVDSTKAIDALEEIISQFTIINDMNQQIANSSQQQGEVVREVDKKVASVITITNSVASHAESVGSLSNELDKISDDIKQGLAKFKL